MKGVLQERFGPKRLPPVAKWTAESDKLTVKRSGLNQQYNALKGEVKTRKSVYSILRQEQWECQPRRVQGMEL